MNLRYALLPAVLALLLLNVVQAQDLRLHMATPSEEISGTLIPYTVTVANASSEPLVNVEVEIQLPSPPEGAFLSSFEPPEDFSGCGEVCDPGELVTWDVGTLDPGGSRVAFYSFLGGITTGEDLREAMGRFNAVASADATGDVSTALNVQLDNTPLLRMSLVPDSGPAVAGEPFGYTLTYVNAGDFSPTGVTLRMPLPEGTQFASATDGGSVEGNVVTWNVGTVVQGEGGAGPPDRRCRGRVTGGRFARRARRSRGRRASRTASRGLSHDASSGVGASSLGTQRGNLGR